MSGPNPLLSEAYETAPVQPTVDDASVDAFIKVAMENNIDLDNMTSEQVHAIYQEVAKTAEASTGLGDELDQVADKFAEAVMAGPAEEKKEDEGEAKESADKIAENFAQFDFAGRVIAHAQWDELKKLAQAEEAAPPSPPEEKKEEEKKEKEKEKEKEAGAKTDAAKNLIKSVLTAIRTKPAVAAGVGGGVGLMAGRASKSKTAEDESAERIMQKVQEKIAWLEQEALEDEIASRTVQKVAERLAAQQGQ